MTTIDTRDAVAVAVVAAIHDGDVDGLRALLVDHPWLAAARLGTDDADGMSRALLHVVTDWPGHFPRGPEAVRVLVDAGADVDARFHGPHEETPLHWAASSNDVAVLDALLDAGADIDAPGSVIAGGGPVEDARAFGNHEAGLRLVERGARTSITDAAGLGLLDRLRAMSPTATAEQIERAFWCACAGGHRACAELLLDRGADIDRLAPWEPRTPLDAAERRGSDDVARWLRARGARRASEL